MRAALAVRLLADADIAAIVRMRVDWLVRPQASALPAITLQTVNDARPRHLGGYQGARPTRVQVDCWAASYVASMSLAKAVIAALAPPAEHGGVAFNAAEINDQRDFSEQMEGGGTLYRQMLDIELWHEGD